jgi:hypothetical protein
MDSGRTAAYRLRGGRQPDVAAVTNVLAHHGVRHPDGGALSEPLVFLASGGIGAGYLLWEFAHDGSKPLVLGFRGQWQYPQTWLRSTVDRLGQRCEVHTTSGSRGAAKKLSIELAKGNPVIVLPDRYLVGYWHLPASAEGMGGHFVVAYDEAEGRVFVDDRNLAPLSVDRAVFDAARDRIASYKNVLLSLKPGTLDRHQLITAVTHGLTECVRRLSSSSASFSLPAWGKWAKLMTDDRSPKGWPTVFADRSGLAGALLSIWEGVDPAGMTGGHLRDLFADGLQEAAPLLGLPALADQATRWRAIAAQWQALGDAALGDRFPEAGWLRGLTTAVLDGVRDGDEAQPKATGSAAELWRLRTHYDADVPFTREQAAALFADLGARLRALHAAEEAAIAELGESFPG